MNYLLIFRFESFVFEPGKHPSNPSYEETTIFYLMCIGAIVGALVFSPSEPYSRSSFSNSEKKALSQRNDQLIAYIKYSIWNLCRGLCRLGP
jgi:hypothetical protein